MSQGLYLFCVARLSRLPSLPLPGSGLDGRSPLEVVGFQDLAAVWGPVPLEDFVGPAAEERLQDLTWVGPRAIRHQEVVAGVMRHSPVLPARFGTIFSTPASLERVLQSHHDTLAESLERLADREEWAVKGMLDRPGARENLFALKLAREADRLGVLSPGIRYFQEQRLRAECERELQAWLQEGGQKLWAELQEYAAKSRERRLLSRETTGSRKDMVFNWTFLVPAKAMAGFQSRLQAATARFAPRGLDLEVTGPWPPYSFCPALDLEPEA